MQPKEKKKKKEEFPQYDFNQQAYYDDSGNFQGFGGGYTYHGMGDYRRPSNQPMYMSGGGQVRSKKKVVDSDRPGSSDDYSDYSPVSSTLGWLLGAQDWKDQYPIPTEELKRDYGMKCGGRVKGMAEGGIVQGAPFNPIEAGIASLAPPGGGASAMRQVDKEIVQQAIMSLTNQIESDEPINRFIERFGKPALADLAQRIVEAEGQQNSGMMIAGPGDGLSDDIPAAAGRQPIQLSDGEFVVPADAVSAIGNGSTNAGSQELQRMIRRIRQEKNNSSQQPPSIDPNKIMPA
jgi:hypothetical protein